MELLPDEYPAFFYRSVHRWYFERDSLARCAEAAGFKVAELRCVHRFGPGNALGWLKDRRPPGRGPFPGMADAGLDAAWRATLAISAATICMLR